MTSVSPHTKLSHHISAIPKLDKKLFISSYLREQKLYAKAYASDGRAIEASWKRPNPPFLDEPPIPAGPTEEYGFGTPILKPRISKQIPQSSPASPNAKKPQTSAKVTEELSDKNRPQEVNRKRQHPESPAKATELRPNDYHSKSSKQLQASVVDSSDEHAMRLKERRDRKRAKRAIVEPINDSDDELDAKSDKNTKPKGKKKPEAKKKVPAGLALMHGFSATNVGSGRLTMKPPLNVGVFGKGKASAKARVTNKRSSNKTGRPNHGFSELEFLNKTSLEPPSKRKRKASASASSAISHSHERTHIRDPGRPTKIKVRKGIAKAKTKSEVQVPKHNNAASNDEITSSSSMASTKEESDNVPASNNPGASKNPITATPKSITWDIEQDNVSLPTHPIPSDAAKSVLLDTRHLTWASATPNEGVELDVSGQKSSSGADLRKTSKCSSPSIGPSQSASQYGRPAAPRMPPLQSNSHSKYFASQVVAQDISKALPEACVSQPAVQIPVQAISASIISQKSSHSPVAAPRTVVSVAKMVSPSDPEHAWSLPPVESHMESLEYLPNVDFWDYEYSDGAANLWTSEETLETRGLDLPGYVDDYDEFHDYDAFAPDDLFESSRISCYDIIEMDNGAFEYDQIFQDMKSGEFNAIEQIFEEVGSGPGPEEHERYTSFWDEGEEHGLSDYGHEDGMTMGDFEEQASVEGGIRLRACVDETSEYLGPGGDEDLTTDNDSDGELLDPSCAEGSESDSGSVSPAAMFSQGRALLQGHAGQGYHTGGSPRLSRRRQVSLVEADVVKSLRNHWLPQRL
ncbi:hypothetical protein Hypma_010281 [Hypsizygus marmoreus]|uniref:Uncharacterized protein n=1 Tax=Hypsizygus marmoreus TaxID=39966 RepID=A0A369JSZ3_HYPMA|nr:hypothetical protein Hypma_010281 [Hypsizygus marmoreus]